MPADLPRRASPCLPVPAFVRRLERTRQGRPPGTGARNHRASPDVDSLWPLLIPILASTLVLVVGAWVVRRYAGPAMEASRTAQVAYVGAIEGRMKILMTERDDLTASLGRMVGEVAALRSNVAGLETSVRDLERQIRDLTSENLSLLRQIRGEQAAPR